MKEAQVGDIILVHNSSFLAKGIQFMMNVYRKKKGLPERKLYNHVALVVNLWGKKYLAEAAGQGIQIVPNADKYIRDRDCKVMTWVKPLTEEEKVLFSREAISYALEPHRYDVLNFFYQIKFIFSGKWRGPTGEKSEKRIYCSEFAAIIMNKVRNSFKGTTWDKNPLDIELSKDLKPLL